MPLKRPKQQRQFGPSKAKEQLILQDLSRATARQFEEALKSIITKVRYTGSAYHRSPGSKAGPIAKRAGLTSKCPPTWTNALATAALRVAITEVRVSCFWEGGFPRYVWHLYQSRERRVSRVSGRRSMAMAEEFSIEPDTFSVDIQWPPAPQAGGNVLLDASNSFRDEGWRIVADLFLGRRRLKKHSPHGADLLSSRMACSELVVFSLRAPQGRSKRRRLGISIAALAGYPQERIWSARCDVCSFR